MTSLERLNLLRGRARRIRGIREKLENSQPTGTPSSTRNGTRETGASWRPRVPGNSELTELNVASA
jgi:hypothetical protein